MKAMVPAAPAPLRERPLALAEIATPAPGPGQVRVRVSGCGVCRTDLHIASGELALERLPIVLGHVELLREAAEVPVRTSVRLFDVEDANEALIAVEEGRVRGAAVLAVTRGPSTPSA